MDFRTQVNRIGLELDRQRQETLDYGAPRTDVFNCSSCTSAVRTEHFITRDDLSFSGERGKGRVNRYVVYEFACGLGTRAPYVDEALTSCRKGNADSVQRCANCANGMPVMLTFPPNERGISRRRMVYLCRSSKVTEHYGKDTAMSAYVCCDEYRAKDR